MSSTATGQTADSYAGTTQFRAIWRRFRRRRFGLAALVFLLLLIISVIVVPIISPFRQDVATSTIDLWMVPLNQNPDMWFAPAATVDPANGYTHWLGTDKLGRDEFTRLFLGGRITLFGALVAAIATSLLGTLVGLVAGFYGGWIDALFMRFTDFVLAWPVLPAYIIAIYFIRSGLPRNELLNNTSLMLTIVILAFVLFSWMGVARLVRGSVLTLRHEPFIEATRALGAGNSRIIFKHLLPNTLTPVLVAATLIAADFIIWEAILAYFGQGISEPPAPTWGNMLADAQSLIWYVDRANPFTEIRFYLFLFPCAMILISTLCINYIADSLRSALTPNEF